MESQKWVDTVASNRTSFFITSSSSWGWIFGMFTTNHKTGYRQLATCFVAASWEKITLHENYLLTFFGSYYILIKYFFARKSLWFCNFTASRASCRQFARHPWDAKNLQDATRVSKLFRSFYAASWERFLVSRTISQ